MDLVALRQELESSAEYLQFSKESQGFYLAHVFSMHTPGSEPAPQFGYYSPATGRIVVFQTRPVVRLPEDEAFNQGTHIAELALGEVTLDAQEAERIALEALKRRAPAETVTKVILFLQHLDRQLFNITLVTATFNLLNVRIDAVTGEVILEEMRSIMSLRRSDEAVKD
jgi:hypothetical protein